MEILDAMLRGGGIAAAAILGLLFVRRGLGTPIGLFGLLQALSTIGYLTCTAQWHDRLSVFWWISSTFCHFIPLCFWLFSRAVFSDIQRVGRLELRVAGVFTFLVLAYMWSISVRPDPVGEIIEKLFRLTGLVMGLYVMFDVLREYRDDLIERRRKVRIYLVGSLGTLYVMLVVNNILTEGARPSGWAGLLIVSALLVLSVSLILLITRLRRDLFPLRVAAAVPGSPVVLPTESDDDSPDDRTGFAPDDLAAVIREMEEEKVYHDETLTITSLARRMGTQEYLLRRIINQGLGQRNFTSFLNGYRLEEVEAALRNPAKIKTPILTLALESGFNSIGPFNRAFKDKHGITPREYRQRYSEDN